MKVSLFCYGLLKPEYEPPATMSDPRPATMTGRIYDLGDDAALEPGGGLAHGVVMMIDHTELVTLDAIETGYTRKVVMVRTDERAYPAYAYVFDGAVPPGSPIVSEWRKKP